MSYLQVIFLLFVLIENTLCDKNIHNVAKKIENGNRNLYSEVSVKIERPWETNIENLWEYPRSDKRKLAKISLLWSQYYSCLYRQMKSLTSAHRLPSISLMVYEGGVARLPCRLCLSPEDKTEVVWTYCESLRNLTFNPMEYKETIVQEENSELTIYHVTFDDAGVYRCQVGRSVSGLVILEIVDSEENYTVVKPHSSHGPYPSRQQTIVAGLRLFNAWSAWSECSACDDVGRRRRHGPCYVALHNKQDAAEGKDTIHSRSHLLDDNTRKLFEDFPRGIPCRSQYLPKAIRNLPAVQIRNNEIMIGLCKEPCKHVIFEVRSIAGEVLERANNTDGIYSLHQKLPPQPPLPVNDIVFAVRGAPTHIQCPGSTLRDMPVTWHVGTKHAVPRSMDRDSGGRVHLNARDHIVFTTVKYSDANLYSCWQRENLAGTVRLVVWEGGRVRCDHHAVLIVLLVTTVVALRIVLRVLRDKQGAVNR